VSRQPLASELIVAKARSEMEGTLVQHEVDAGRLILLHRKRGNHSVPATEMASLRLESALRLKEIFRTLENVGSPSRDESYILSMLSDAEKAAADKFKRLESFYQNSTEARLVERRARSPQEVGGLGVPPDQVIQSAQPSDSIAISTGSFAGNQLQSAPLELLNQSRSFGESSRLSDALAGAYLGTDIVGADRSTRNYQVLSGPSGTVSTASQLASFSAQAQPNLSGFSSGNLSSELARLLGSQSSNTRDALCALRAYQTQYGQSPTGAMFGNGMPNNGMLGTLPQSFAYQFPPQPLQETPNQRYQQYDQFPPQQFEHPPNHRNGFHQSQAAYQQLYFNGSRAGLNPAMSETSRAPPRYTMNDLEPRTMEEMQQQTSGSYYSQNGYGRQGPS